MPENTAVPLDSLIKNADMTNFVADVIEASQDVPVLVDFWSLRSEPCKTLMPVLEKVVRDAGGAVRLVKVNVDENQQIASQMQVRSVPTVVAFKDGRPVDAFSGPKSESEIRDFLSQIAPDMAPSPIEEIMAQAAAAFEADDFEAAGALYSQILQTESENPDALAGLGQSLLKLGDHESAGQVLGSVPQKLENHPAIAAARAALETALQMGDVGDSAALEKAVSENADNHEARFDLALALWAAGQQEEAADHLLEIVARDREWREDGARAQLVKFFDMAGPMDPFTVAARRKLSGLLFN